MEEISEQTIPIDIGEKIDKFEQNKSQNSIFEVFLFGTSKNFYSLSPVLPKSKVILDQKSYSKISRSLKKFCDLDGLSYSELEKIDDFRK